MDMDGQREHGTYAAPELLAPAGSMEALRQAVCAGANAVYVGGSQFGARAFAQNFTQEELLEALDYVHRRQVKLYLTVNTLLKEKELRQALFSYLLPFYERGLDAVIVQDVGVLSAVREWFPDLAVHASTQMGVLSESGARFLKERGVVRVVPGRELSLQEVKRITAISGLQVECFAHGAMCYCYSGQCFLSSRIGGRSGNRGRCAQPCRLPYTVEQKGAAKGTARPILSLKDMCTVEFLPELLMAGMDSFKLEGRMKKPEYVAAVTAVYRKSIDRALECRKTGKPYTVDRDDAMLLAQMYNRGGFHGGYFMQHNGAEMLTDRRVNHHGVYVGKIDRIDKNYISFYTEWDIFPGDVLEIRGLRSKSGHTAKKESVTLTCPIAVPAGQSVRLKASSVERLCRGLPLYRMKSPALIAGLMGRLAHGAEISLAMRAVLRVGSPVSLRVVDCAHRKSVQVVGEPVQAARSQPLCREQVERLLSQTGSSGYVIQKLELDMEDGVFLPVKAMKELRRRGILEWERQIGRIHSRVFCPQEGQLQTPLKSEERACTPPQQPISIAVPSLQASVHTAPQLYLLAKHATIKRLYVPLSLLEEAPHGDGDAQIYAALPRMFRAQQEAQLNFQRLADRVQGFLVPTVDALAWLLSHDGFGKRLGVVLEDTMHAYNRRAAAFWQNALCGSSSFYLAGRTAPAELTRKEMEELAMDDLILPVYGRRVMMTSAQCLKKTLGRCDHTPGVQRVYDRVGKAFLIENCCDACYNVIWEAEPLSLSTHAHTLKALHPIGLRLDFTQEQPDTVRRVVRAFEQEFLEGQKPDDAIAGNTGHMYEAVQ